MTVVVMAVLRAKPESGQELERLVFEDRGEGRTRLTSTSLVDSFADRDDWLASGMEVAVSEGYQCLDELLTP